nr:reverse transcriptase domain-containing protein [Tanacetum cinerariifolium]
EFFRIYSDGTAKPKNLRNSRPITKFWDGLNAMKLCDDADANATPRVNIQDFCEEYYKDILPIIMDMIRRDKRKEVHARLDFGEGSMERRIREGSHYSSARTLSARANLTDLAKLTRQAQPSPDRTGQAPGIVLAIEVALTGGNLLIEIVLRVETALAASGNHMKTPIPPMGPTTDIAIATETALAVEPRGSPKIFQAVAHVERWAMPSWCHMFNSTLTGATRVWFDELPPESIDSYKDLKATFLAYLMQQKKYVKDPVEIHNIKQKDGETIEDFMERFKVETRHIKGAPKCEAAVAGKKKGHTSWRTHVQLKRHTSEKRSDFQGQPREGRGSNRFTPLIRTPKEIPATKAGKFQPPPPMVTLVEKRSSNKFCVFHNDKEHSTDECMRLKKQIEELVRAGKLLHLIKEIKQGLDQSKVGKKEAPAKDKPMAIYMIQSWKRMTRQKVTQSFERVREITFPSLVTSSGTEGPLVIEAEIGGHMIHRMYVDGGSSMEVLYEHYFNRLRPKVKNQMFLATTSLTGFSGETIWPLGQLRLLVTIGDADHSTRAWMNFMIIRSLSPYNDIIERPRIKEIQAEIPKEAGVRHENFKVALHPNFPDQEVAIGGTLSAKGRIELCSLLKENLDIFAWQSSDMTGVPQSVAEHRLNIREGYSPVRQKKRGQVPERAKAIQAELENERRFHEFKQGMSAGLLPFPEIDWKVESLCGYPFKCFLDAYKGYHQIQLAESNEEKTTFHTDHGVYCYTKMPFGLKNVGATCQRLVDKAFDSQISQNIEVYVDDLVIKSHTEAEMLRDIGETFRMLRKINMKLNPKKCTFGAVEGMFLGYMITLKGIKPCLDKTEVVLQLSSPRTIKKVQRLNGKLASPNRFLSKSAEKYLPLFKTLKKCIKKSDFHWTSEAEQAFKQLKKHFERSLLNGSLTLI